MPDVLQTEFYVSSDLCKHCLTLIGASYHPVGDGGAGDHRFRHAGGHRLRHRFQPPLLWQVV